MNILKVLDKPVITWNNYPTAISDYFMIDFSGKKADEQIELSIQKDSNIIVELRKRVSACRRLNVVSADILNRRGYIYRELIHKNFYVSIQQKYYDYFIDKYGDCKFYTSARNTTPVAVRKNGKLLGVIMPLVWIN
jgi:hypothetical protein